MYPRKAKVGHQNLKFCLQWHCRVSTRRGQQGFTSKADADTNAMWPQKAFWGKSHCRHKMAHIKPHATCRHRLTAGQSDTTQQCWEGSSQDKALLGHRAPVTRLSRFGQSEAKPEGTEGRMEGTRDAPTRGSALHTAVTSWRCPAGRLEETRPEGTGIAGLFELLPVPNAATSHPAPRPHAATNGHRPSDGALRDHSSRRDGEGSAVPWGNGAKYRQCAAERRKAWGGQRSRPSGEQRLCVGHPRRLRDGSHPEADTRDTAGFWPCSRWHRRTLPVRSRRWGPRGNRLPALYPRGRPHAELPEALPHGSGRSPGTNTATTGTQGRRRPPHLVLIELLPLRLQAVPGPPAQHPCGNALDAVHGCAAHTAQHAPRTPGTERPGAARSSSRPRTAAPPGGSARPCRFGTAPSARGSGGTRSSVAARSYRPSLGTATQQHAHPRGELNGSFVFFNNNSRGGHNSKAIPWRVCNASRNQAATQLEFPRTRGL